MASGPAMSAPRPTATPSAARSGWPRWPHRDGVTGPWLKSGGFRVRTPAGDVPARLQIAPLYDPQRLRILDQ